MSTHTICFYGEIRKIIPELSPNIPLILTILLIRIYFVFTETDVSLF